MEATLALLADELASEGFTLKAGLQIKRNDGEFADLIRAQSSTWNRGGVQAWFNLTAIGESARLSVFKKERWPGRRAAVTKFDRWVTSRQLKWIGQPRTARWDAIDPAARPGIAREAAAIIRADILPWFQLARDPLWQLSQLVDHSTNPRILTFAVALDEADAAKARIAELRATNSRFEEAFRRLKRDAADRGGGNAFDAVVLTALELDLA